MSDVLIKVLTWWSRRLFTVLYASRTILKQQGRDTYVLDEFYFRNKEIYDLVWDVILILKE